MVLDIGRRRHHVEEGRDVVDASHGFEIAAPIQCVSQHDRIQHVVLLHDGDHAAEQPPVGLFVERLVYQKFGRLQRRVLIEQHGAQDGLFGFRTPRNPAVRRCLSARQRGGVVRYERHPRLVSSNSGCEGVQRGGR